MSSNKYPWLQSARIFMLDALQYPFSPNLEFDAEELAETMADTHANAVRFATVGKYSTIQGVRFPTHPDQGDRDYLSETIEACKPRGIRVVPYISTGHSVAWSIVSRDYPEYAQITSPGSGSRRHAFPVGEDHGTVCFSTPYRQAFLDLVEHVVRNYDIDGIYFDSWIALYFWRNPATMLLRRMPQRLPAASGSEIPCHERYEDYTSDELKTIGRFHEWHQDQLVEVMRKTRSIVALNKDMPTIYNVFSAREFTDPDPRILESHDAFLYERTTSLLHLAESVSLARGTGLMNWAYTANSPSKRVPTGGVRHAKEILTAAAFGGAPISNNPYQFT